MNFHQQLSSELNEIINDLEKGDGGRKIEAGVLRLENFIETTHLNDDVWLEIMNIMNQAREHLRIALYGEQSLRCFEKTNSTHL